MNSKQQGDIGVAEAIAYYVRNGYAVSIPMTDNTRYDLIVDNGTISRVQIKHTKHISNKSYQVDFRTQGGNQSWNGTVKKITSDECDLVFVHCPLGNYEFPSSLIDGRSTLNLSEKYKEYKLG